MLYGKRQGQNVHPQKLWKLQTCPQQFDSFPAFVIICKFTWIVGVLYTAKSSQAFNEGWKCADKETSWCELILLSGVHLFTIICCCYCCPSQRSYSFKSLYTKENFLHFQRFQGPFPLFRPLVRSQNISWFYIVIKMAIWMHGNGRNGLLDVDTLGLLKGII